LRLKIHSDNGKHGSGDVAVSVVVIVVNRTNERKMECERVFQNLLSQLLEVICQVYLKAARSNLCQNPFESQYCSEGPAISFVFRF